LTIANCQGGSEKTNRQLEIANFTTERCPQGWFDHGAEPILRLRWILRKGDQSSKLSAPEWHRQ